tara:strand:+ start:865 stop:1239 length:375 start_codon:yes stop_codon:yes gene_type:complete
LYSQSSSSSLAEIASLAIGKCLIIKSNFMLKINFMDSVYESNRSIVDIQKVLEQIKTGRWKKQIDEIRYHINNGDTEQAGNIKRNLPAITISATFKEGGRTKLDVDTYTNLLHLDYDYMIMYKS